MKRKLFTLLLTALILCRTVFAAPSFLIPGGKAVGIELFTDGLLVTRLEDDSPASRAGIRIGDRIMEADGTPLSGVGQLADRVAEGSAVVLSINRNGRAAEFLLTPEQSPEGYRLGLFLRDRIAGIGTVTYYDPLTGGFGALGHGVSDTHGDTLLAVSSGVLIASEVSSVTKGARGRPGALQGSFFPEEAVGVVESNTVHGIFGSATAVPLSPAIPLAEPGEVRLGNAEIYANVEGTRIERFSVRIEKLHATAENGRNLLLRVTDERLLGITGGIVQGMSGSPILQNGKLVGAVTHVLVSDPTMGYGIFIQNMLDEITEEEK